MAGLVSGRGSLESLLTEIATFAMLAVPGADGAGVTMLEAGQPDTIVASAQFVRDVDTIQYRLGEGPCISAAASGETNGSGALGQDASWPVFGPRAAELDVHSALSLALKVNTDVLGALNVYSHAYDAFDGSSKRIGELFAAPAAVAIHNARLLDQTLRQAARLEVALTSRSTIDQAIGIIIARSGVTSDEAFVRLRIMSQHEHIKLSLVAERLVAQAMRRARVKRSESDE
ncbi:GAF and ANTAR domain-containing protein [uncultured Jatrophihabitans sp.]|uniref:GAF and ANTAR domain-containing protein n=1 Tax=uncultured Jatrophihabitans sp. TaxID=1610747 RepID=UPI0035CCA12E